jgi:hypothetical protein
MKLDRRSLAALGAGAAALVAFAAPAVADGADLTAVAQGVEAFRAAMIAADRKAFEQLCADELSYGHSAGKIESKQVFIDNATNGKSSWTTLNFSDVSNSVAGNNAISRFMLTGQTLSEGKTTDIKIGVLMVWAKQGGNWQLLARQAFRV